MPLFCNITLQRISKPHPLGLSLEVSSLRRLSLNTYPCKGLDTPHTPTPTRTASRASPQAALSGVPVFSLEQPQIVSPVRTATGVSYRPFISTQ